MPIVSVPTGQQLITESLRKKGSELMPAPPAPAPKRKSKKDMTEYTSIVLLDSDKPEIAVKKPRTQIKKRVKD
jgi:hypothetical protein